MIFVLIALVVLAGGLSGTTAAAAGRAAWFLAALTGVLIAAPVAESLRSAYYATGNTVVPVRLDAVVFTGGLVLKVAGFAVLGVVGLALGASTQAVVGALVLRRAFSSGSHRSIAQGPR